jgi:hypothetical protein
MQSSQLSLAAIALKFTLKGTLDITEFTVAARCSSHLPQDL